MRAGVVVKRVDRSWQIEDARRHEIGEHRGERGLEADRAGRGLVELGLLLLDGVRRVVGRDDVDRAVGQRGAQRITILGRRGAAG